MISRDNFYIGTKATFKGCKVPRRQPDYVSYDRCGNVSSRYWYSNEGVIRASDHWSIYRYLNDGKAYRNHECVLVCDPSDNLENMGCNNISSCFWILKTNHKGMKKIVNNGYKWLDEIEVMAGFCKWNKFKKL